MQFWLYLIFQLFPCLINKIHKAANNIIFKKKESTCTLNCLNGGACQLVNGVQQCACLSGFTGTNCQIGR